MSWLLWDILVGQWQQDEHQQSTASLTPRGLPKLTATTAGAPKDGKCYLNGTNNHYTHALYIV